MKTKNVVALANHGARIDWVMAACMASSTTGGQIQVNYVAYCP